MRVIHISTWALRIHLFVDKNNAIRLDPQMFYLDVLIISIYIRIYPPKHCLADSLVKSNSYFISFL